MVRSRFQFTYASEGAVFGFILFIVYFAIIIGIWVEMEMALLDKWLFTAFCAIFIILPVLTGRSVKRVEIDNYRIILNGVFGGEQRIYSFQELDGICPRRHPDGRIEPYTLLLVKQGQIEAVIYGDIYENIDELLAALPEGVLKKERKVGEWELFKVLARQGMWR